MSIIKLLKLNTENVFIFVGIKFCHLVKMNKFANIIFCKLINSTSVIVNQVNFTARSRRCSHIKIYAKSN